MQRPTGSEKSCFRRLAVIIAALPILAALSFAAAAPASASSATPSRPNTYNPVCVNHAYNSHYVWSDEEWPGGADWSVAAWGPGTLGMFRAESVSNTFSSQVQITAGAVSAAVGFSVTWTGTVTTYYSINVPAGEEWEIIAGYNDLVYQYDVYKDCYIYERQVSHTYEGHGWAYQYHNLVYLPVRLV